MNSAHMAPWERESFIVLAKFHLPWILGISFLNSFLGKGNRHVLTGRTSRIRPEGKRRRSDSPTLSPREKIQTLIGSRIIQISSGSQELAIRKQPHRLRHFGLTLWVVLRAKKNSFAKRSHWIHRTHTSCYAESNVKRQQWWTQQSLNDIYVSIKILGV